MIGKIKVDFRFLNRFQFQHIYFLLAIFWYILMWYNSVLFSQLNDPPVSSMQNDLTYFLLYKIHFFDLIIHSDILSLVFDITLFLSILSSFIFCAKTIFPKIFVVLYTYYFLTFFFYSGSHGSWVGILMTCWLFIAKTDIKFAIYFEVVRYYILFHFVSAGIYKVVHSGLYHLDSFAKTIFVQNEYVLFENPNSWRSTSILYLSNNPSLVYCFLLGGCLLELAFIVGFFTKKFDVLLFFLVILFMLSCLFFMNIVFYEMPFFALFLIFKVKPDFQTFTDSKESVLTQS